MQSWVRWWMTTIWWQKSASFPVVLLAEWLSSCPPKSVWTQASCVLPNPQSSGSKFLIIVQSLSNHDFFHPSQEIDLSPHPHPHATEVLKNIEEPCVPAVPGLYSKEFLENRMCVALGGRLAEEIINGKDNVTTGASNDFQQCNSLVNGYWWLLYQLSSHGFMLRLLRLLSSVQIHGKMRSKSPNYC